MSAASDPERTPARPAAEGGKRSGGPLGKENRRLLAGLVLGAVVAAFAVVNLNEVEVDWVVATTQTPLIIVIAVSFLLGLLAGWIVSAVGRRRQRSTDRPTTPP